MKNVFQCLKSNADLKPTFQTYAAYLECYGRIFAFERENNDIVEDVKTCLSEIEEHVIN